MFEVRNDTVQQLNLSEPAEEEKQEPVEEEKKQAQQSELQLQSYRSNPYALTPRTQQRTFMELFDENVNYY